jgi:hypothetical protein
MTTAGTMTISTLTQEEVSRGHCALMDWSSFFKLTDPQSITILRQKMQFAGDPALIRESISPFLLDLIARLVVYDALILDTAVQETFRNPLSREAVSIVPVRFETSVYETASETTVKSLAALQSRGANLRQQLESDDFFFGDLKSYADQVSRGIYGLGSAIADSNKSVARVIFYLELSRNVGLQMFLSYEKRDLLKRLHTLLWQDAFAIVSKTLDSTVLKNLPVVPETEDTRMQTPSVVDLVIRHALNRKISLEESIIAVRNLDGAQDFRDLLAQVQRLLMLGDHASILKINQLLAPLVKAAQTWAAAADPDVTKLLAAKFSKLPWIGNLLEALGLGEAVIPIKVPYRGYLQFVSEWYRTDLKAN